MGGLVMWFRESAVCWLVLTLCVREIRAWFPVPGTRIPEIVMLLLPLSLPADDSVK
jgi:hypothetical protein